MSVVIKNRTGQKLDVPIADDKGRPAVLIVKKYAASQPMPKTRITKYTKKLETQGYIRIREVK